MPFVPTETPIPAFVAPPLFGAIAKLYSVVGALKFPEIPLLISLCKTMDRVGFTQNSIVWLLRFELCAVPDTV